VFNSGDTGQPGRCCLGSSYAALPVTITALRIKEVINPDIAHLTALQELQLCNGYFEGFTVAPFRRLRQLSFVAQHTAEGLLHSRMSQFTYLTQLEHLTLSLGWPGRQALEAPFAACTCLSYLSLVGMQYIPEGLLRSDWQLTRLAELHLPVVLLVNPAQTEQVVGCCPNLRTLKLYDLLMMQRSLSEAAAYHDMQVRTKAHTLTSCACCLAASSASAGQQQLPIAGLSVAARDNL
jgi:hypothetical protein